MQPSTWSDTNQHWIPQFLLKGFGIRGNASSVYELDKQTNAIAVRKVSDVASKPRLLTERDDALMRSIESHASTAIEAVRKGHLSRIDENARQAVDKLVCAMILNDPYSGPNDEEIRKKVIAETVGKLGESVSRYGGTLDEPDFRDLFDEGLNHDMLSEFMDSARNRVILALRLMGLQARRPTDGEFFVIGDSPVLVVRNAMNGEPSLLNPGSQVILPIGSRCILTYTWATEMNMIDGGGTIDKEQVRSLNSDYWHGTKCRYIYGRNGDALKRSRLLSLDWRPGERSNEIQSGWFMMQRLEQIAQEQYKEQDTERAKLMEDGARELVETAIAQATQDQNSSGHGQ